MHGPQWAGGACTDLVNFIAVMIYFLLEFEINHVEVPRVFAEMGILPLCLHVFA